MFVRVLSGSDGSDEYVNLGHVVSVRRKFGKLWLSELLLSDGRSMWSKLDRDSVTQALLECAHHTLAETLILPPQ
jgi:hypothetical protein